MKGAVNIKHLTTNRQRAQNLSWQPALFRLRRTVEAGFAEIRSFITTWCRLQKLKSDAVGDGRRPRFYLSLNGLLLFPVVRGGIEFYVGLRPKPRPPRSVGSSPSTLCVPSTPTTKCRIYRSAGKPLETAMSSNSVSSDRTLLLSSTLSVPLQQSCVPASTAPSQRVSPSAGDAQRSCGKARSGYRQRLRQ